MKANDWRESPLFDGITPTDAETLCRELGAAVRTYGRGAFLWHAGDAVSHLGIVVQGTVDAVQYRADGTVQLVARHTAGGIIGDMLTAAGEKSPVSLTAPGGAKVLLLSIEAILGADRVPTEAHVQLRCNLLQHTAAKYWQLRRQLQYLSEPRIRQRVLLFLQDQQKRQGSDCFSIPFSREELAEYLCVNRSALSRELARMKAEGLLDYYRNAFRLFRQ